MMRCAVLLLYFWSALLAFAGVALSYQNQQWVVVTILGALAVIGLLISLVPSFRPRAKHRRSGGDAARV